ncbi:hypothetical protein Tco_0267309 [Tanacetum coccineum]
MANISNYGSDIISDVPNSKTYLNNMDNQRNTTVFKNESKEKENRYMENEIDLEKKIKELDNIICKVGQSAQTVYMLTKPQAFYDNIHKQALGYQNPLYLKRAQRIKPTLYDGVVISNTHVDMPVIDDEETLILEEESRSNMSEKAKNPEVIAKKISHKPVDYEKLNKLTEDFGELPKVSLVNASLKKHKFHLAQFDYVVKKMTTPNALEEEVFQNDESCVNQNAAEIPEYFEINDLKAQLLDKDTTICKLKDTIKSLRENTKEENVFKDQFDSIKQTRVRHKEQSDSLINKLNLKSVENEDLKAQIQDKSMILELLPPRLLQNREVHITYLRNTQEQANILWEIVEQAKAKQPLDSELDLACKYATRIQELLVYVQDTCPNAITPSAKKVTVKPMNNVKKVRFVEPLTSSSKIQQVESSNTSDSNTHVLSSTGVKCSTSNCGSKPPGNKKNDRISQTPSSSKMAMIVKSKNVNHSEPNQTWGSNATDIPSSSSLIMTVRFGNDQITRIMGYGDYQLVNVVISKVYYVEGLGHNLFSVGQFCDANLEVAF